jgi:hypothetical protein
MADVPRYFLEGVGLLLVVPLTLASGHTAHQGRNYDIFEILYPAEELDFESFLSSSTFITPDETKIFGSCGFFATHRWVCPS